MTLPKSNSNPIFQAFREATELLNAGILNRPALSDFGFFYPFARRRAPSATRDRRLSSTFLFSEIAAPPTAGGPPASWNLFFPSRGTAAPALDLSKDRKQGAIGNRSPLLRHCRVPFQKNVYASAIGLCKDSIIMQSTQPSNSDFWRSFNM